jgi:hypothetical protein
MSNHDIIVISIIGGVFLLLGLISFLWSRREEGSWYNSVSTKIDVREFIDRNPGHPEPNSLRTGGKIFMAVGLVILLIALGFLIFS